MSEGIKKNLIFVVSSAPLSLENLLFLFFLLIWFGFVFCRFYCVLLYCFSSIPSLKSVVKHDGFISNQVTFKYMENYICEPRKLPLLIF